MRKLLAVACLAAIGLLAAATLFSLFTPAATRCDFNYRMAEVDCVKRRVDPFRVWNEEISLKPYYSNSPAIKAIPEGCTQDISVYAPWEYTLMMPFSWIDKDVAWWAFSLLSLCAWFLALSLAMRESRPEHGWSGAIVLATVPALIVAHATWSNFQVGNHAVIVLFAAIAMAYCLNRKKDMAAGLCWAFMMIKPQIGLIFAVPLVLRMKVLMGIIAVGVCLLLSIYPAVHCHASLLDMLMEPSKATAFAFEGCGTWPRFLCDEVAGGGDILAGTLIGALLCAIMTWLIRKEKDWFVYLMPAAITSCCWTYTQAYSHIMGWFVAFALLRELTKHPHTKFLWGLSVLAVLSLTRWFLAWHGLVLFAGWRFPMSDYAFRCVDSFNSTISLTIAILLCVWLASHPHLEK